MNNNLPEDPLENQEEEIVLNTLKRAEEIEATIEKDLLPEGFELDAEGLWFLEKRAKEDPYRVWLSSPLRITAYTRDFKNQNHGRILEFSDIDNYKHLWTMGMELLAGDAARILGALLNMGLLISSGKKSKDRIIDYITLCKPLKKARCVSQTGWANGAFILPTETIGSKASEVIIYQNPTAFESTKIASGILEEWQEKISKKAQGNSRLTLTLSASFTGPVLDLMHHENIGIHLRGSSSLGKSTAGFVANSVWDCEKNVHPMRSTSNGLEGLAFHYNDRLFCLDELGQASPHDIGHTIYMLGNGTGKNRATNQGSARNQNRWRLVFLSNGELSLEQLLNEVGKKTKAGQEVRLIDLPANTGKFGLFENLHEFENGSDFSKYLKNACKEFYGTAGKAFLLELVKDPEGAVNYVKAVINGLEQRFLPKDACGQVIRVFNNFALIAATGELATKYKITAWKVEEAVEGVMKCFQDWLNTRGNLGMHEEEEAIAQIKSFFEQHAESRFSSWKNDPIEDGRTSNRVGFKKEELDKDGVETGGMEFYVFSQSFRKELCKGLDHKTVEAVCIKNNLLQPGTNNSPTRPERLPGSNGTTRCYRFTSKVLIE